MTTRSYDIYFGQTHCGTVWARTVEIIDKEAFCIETCLKYGEVKEIGLNKVRTKARYIFSRVGKPRKIEISSDHGASVEINVSDTALNYGKENIVLDHPIDCALGGNMVPLLAIWWKEFKANQPGTFITLLPETGAVIDYTLEDCNGTLRSNLGEEFILDDEGEIYEVRPDASDFIIRRGKRPFPKWNFKNQPEQFSYRPPKDLNIHEVKMESDGKVVEATVARPLDGPATVAAIFIGGTGIYGRHGITANIDIGYHQLLDDLARQGIATVRYEKFVQGTSNPAQAEGAIDFQTLCHDAQRWLNWLDRQPWADGLPRILIGHSMGGVIALALSSQHSDISSCVLLNTPGRPLSDVIENQSAWHEEHTPSSDEAKMEARRMRQALLYALKLDEEWTEDTVDRKLLPMKHKRKFLRSVINLDPCELITQANCPLVLIRGTADVQIFAEDAKLILNAAQSVRRPIQYLEAEGLDHLLKRSRKTGREALTTYRDRRRRIPIALIRKIADTIKQLPTA